MRWHRLPSLLGLLGLSLAGQAETLFIAGVAGYQKPLQAIYREFTAQQGIEINAAFGNLQHVLAQTRMSGRVELVVGARQLLQETGLFERLVPLGEGRLVLAFSRRAQADYTTLTAPSIRRIALPDPQRAIYGRAALQFFERSGLQSDVADKLMILRTVPQVSAYLLAGSVDAGLLNLTDARSLGERVGSYTRIPTALYDPPCIVVAVPAASPAKPAADAFLAFLEQPAVTRILTHYGLRE